MPAERLVTIQVRCAALCTVSIPGNTKPADEMQAAKAALAALTAVHLNRELRPFPMHLLDGRLNNEVGVIMGFVTRKDDSTPIVEGVLNEGMDPDAGNRMVGETADTEG